MADEEGLDLDAMPPLSGRAILRSLMTEICEQSRLALTDKEIRTFPLFQMTLISTFLAGLLKLRQCSNGLLDS